MSDNAKYKHIFIAYASKDQAAYDTLLSHLNVLKEENNVEIWSKAELTGGTEVEKEIHAQLEKTDMVILLVSVDVLNSRIYEIIEGAVEKSVAVVPVLLRNCDWRNYSFIEDKQPLPKSGKFIADSKNKDKAYTEIAQEIKKMVVGKGEDVPSVSLVNESPFGKIFGLILLVAVLALAGIFWETSLLNSEDKTPTMSEILSTAYGTPIFTADTSLFKILIIRFEDNLNEDDDTYCIGRSILESFIQLKIKGLPIYPIYKDSLESPIAPEEAELIQQHHNTDVLIYGLANEIQDNCTSVNVCFRHAVANTIMANLDILKDRRIKHDNKYERMSHKDIEKGKLSVDEQSMEAWIKGLVALKKNDKETYLREIEKMTVDIAHLTNDERAIIFFNQGVLYNEFGNDEKAISSYNKFTELNRDFDEAYNNIGYSYFTLKKYKKAILNYDKAINLNSGYFDAYLVRGQCFINSRNYKKAISDFDKIIELKPDFSTNYLIRGSTFQVYLKEYKKAISDYDKALELKSDNVDAYYYRALCYYNLGDYKRTILDSDKVIELEPKNINAYYLRGNSYYGLKDYRKAIIDFDRLIELNPNFVEVYFYRGFSYGALGEHRKAIIDYTQVVELMPNPAKAYFYRGLSYSILKENEKAILDLNRAKELGYDGS